MKIALVCPYNMFERPGGVQKLITHLHEGLVKKGHVVKVITQRPTGFKGSVPEDYILFGTVRSFSGGDGSTGAWGMPADREEINKILQKEKFDVINFHEPWIPMLAWQMLKHSNAAHVGTFHASLIDTTAGKTWTSSIFTPYGRPLLRQMHIFTATSPASAGMLINRANMKSPHERELVENIKYIANGIDLHLYHPPKKKLPLNGPNTKTIVYVGRLDRRKGVNYLIRAFAALQDEMPSAYLIIAGEGSLRGRYEQLAKSLDIKNIHFSGYVSEDEKRRLMGNADVFCSPALFGESFGIVLIEAMAMGTPVIGGRNAGYIHVLTGTGRLGLVGPKSIDDFAARLKLVMTDGKVNRLLRDWGLREVKKYNYPKIISQYEAAYKEALEQLTNGKAKVKSDESQKRTISRFFVRRHA